METKKKNKAVWISFLSILISGYFCLPTMAKASSQSNVYRFWSDTMQGHFYTASLDEKNEVIAKYPTNVWKYEGVGFQVFTTQESGATPIYRFWSDTKRGHFYTASLDEKNEVIAKYPTNVWKYEGVAWYAYVTEQPGTTPVYRFWSDQKQHHFFTFDPNEKSCIQNSYPESVWKYEGIAYYVPGTAPTFDPNATCGVNLGPEISVGLWYYGKSDIMNSPFAISASKPYIIKDANGTTLTQADGVSAASVSYNDPDNQLTVSVGTYSNTLASKTVSFEAADGDNSSLILTTNRSSFISDWRGKIDRYRGKIRVQYYRGYDIVSGAAPGSANVTQIWVNNILPLEQYAWGSAETSGTGNMNHTQVMSTMYRTYGFWYIKYANKYAALGFKIRSDSGSQNYGGYDWEVSHPNVKQAAQNTRGIIASYGGDVAITPYSSWSDGRTRSWEEKWGSTAYPWCQSVDDPYGKNVAQSGGSHMVGLIANGSVNLAANYGWGWDQILKYYYTGIGLNGQY